MRKIPSKHDILCVKCRHWEGELKLSEYPWGDGYDVLTKCYVLGGFISAPNEHCFNFFGVRRTENRLTKKQADIIEEKMRQLETDPTVSKRELRLFMQLPMPCGHATGNLLTCDKPPSGCVKCLM